MLTPEQQERYATIPWVEALTMQINGEQVILSVGEGILLVERFSRDTREVHLQYIEPVSRPKTLGPDS